MLIVLAASALSVTTADLFPPFISSETGKVGYWETGGAALVEDQLILLVPPIQWHKGCLWSNVEIPPEDWCLELELQVPEGNSGGGFGVWFVSQFGADGALIGGPTDFSGLAILVRIITIPKTSQPHLTFQVLQDGSRYNETLPIRLPFSPYEPFTLKVYLRGGNYTVNCLDRDLINDTLITDLRQNFIGITAANEKHFSRIDLLNIHFVLDRHRDHELVFRPDTFLQLDKPSGRVTQTSIGPLKRAAFALTAAEFEGRRTSRYGLESTSGADVWRVLDIIEEIHAANFDVASFAELNQWVNDRLLRYAQKWQSRTVKIVDRVQKARDVTGAAWNFTGRMMTDFNATLKATVLKTQEKIADIHEALSYFAAEGIGEGGGLRETAAAVERAWLTRLVMYIAQIEFVTIILFFIVVNIPSVKAKLIGGS